MSIVNQIHGCEVCGDRDPELVLDLGKHPLCDDLIPIGDPSQCVEYPIEILYCDRCRTAHQRLQVPKRRLFPSNYHYRSRFTADVLKGMENLVDACERQLGGSLQGKSVLDVGSNDGSLLDFFRQKGAKTIGVEPTDACADAFGKGHELYNRFFDPAAAVAILEAHGSPDVIAFANVFAHIENISELITALRTLMSPRTMIVIENHYLGAVLDRHQFDTFYHEHPRTYSLTSFQHIASSLGAELKAFAFPSRYGGNIRVMIGGTEIAADPEISSMKHVLYEERKFGARLRATQTVVAEWQASMKSRLENLVAHHGAFPAKAFPARAAILVNLLDVDVETIEAVHERPGSMKIGTYVPGTRIPIMSDDDLFARVPPPPVLLNLAWHISSEINSYLRREGFQGEVIDIMDPRELPS